MSGCFESLQVCDESHILTLISRYNKAVTMDCGELNKLLLMRMDCCDEITKF